VLGQTIQDLRLPGNALIISVVRSDNAMIPQKDTRFENGDSVIAMVVAEEEPQLRHIFAEAHS